MEWDTPCSFAEYLQDQYRGKYPQRFGRSFACSGESEIQYDSPRPGVPRRGKLSVADPPKPMKHSTRFSLPPVVHEFTVSKKVNNRFYIENGGEQSSMSSLRSEKDKPHPNFNDSIIPIIKVETSLRDNNGHSSDNKHTMQTSV